MLSTLLGTARLLDSRSALERNQRTSIRDAWPCIAILFAFFVTGIHAALVRPFWFDELSTLFVSSTPTIREMFRAIPTDGNPPLYFLLARIFLHLPVSVELALRLPALLAYLLAALTIYWFVRRDASRIYALLSMSMFLGCGMHSYAIEARAYSLLMGFTGITICSWQYYRQSGKRLALLGISLGILGAIFTHQYGVLYSTLPLIGGEFARTLRRRSLDQRVVYAMAIPTLALLLTYPTMLRAQQPLLAAIHACPVFFAHPKFSNLKLYADMVPPFILPLAILACVALLLKLALIGASREEPASESLSDDLAVATTLALFLPIMLLATHFGTNFFMRRYGIGSAMGLSLLSGLLLSRLHWRHAPQLAWLGVVYSLAIAFLGIWMVGRSGAQPWNDPILRARDIQEPIVIASALRFSSMWWYADGPTRAHLHYLADPDYARLHSDLIPEYSLALEHAYTPMQMDDYHSFVQSNRHFLLYSYDDKRLEWVKERLIREGWNVRLLKSARIEPVGDEGQRYRELYMVSSPR